MSTIQLKHSAASEARSSTQEIAGKTTPWFRIPW